MIFLDLDGTLLDETKPHNQRVWLEAGKKIWSLLSKEEVCILSKVKDDSNKQWKEQWIDNNLRQGMKRYLINKQERKEVFCTPGDVLIDNNKRNKLGWEAKGGIFLTPEEFLRGK